MPDSSGSLYVLALTVALLLGCAVAAAMLGRRVLPLVYPLCLVAALIGAAGDLTALLSGASSSIHLPLGLPTIGLRFRIDALSAFFGLVINLGVAAASLYGLGLDRQKDLSPRIEPFVPAFAAAMNIVLLADDAFAFLFFWELMSVTSWALVIANHEDASARRAAHVYLLMASIGTIALLFAFGGLAGPAGGYDFDSIRDMRPEPAVAALVLVAVLIGTGSKAGIMPLHAWLPLAHPAAPSHVSALMSGVMTKVAVYGLIRVVFDLIGEPVWWWSLPFIVLGALTAVGALLYAVVDEDLKRVLAYSTVENVGIIYVALGLALAFKATGLDAAAAVSMTAALLHVIFHSWYKMLLFLGAGAVLHSTGRRDFAGLGGLIHRMPRTALLFLVGALAISALPPLNGFVSEWLLFQAVLAGPGFPEPVLRFLIPAVGGLLALAAALAAACFVRVYGIVFLGRPRSGEAASAREVPVAQWGAMALLAGLCIAGGLFAAPLIDILKPLTTALVGAALPGSGTGPTPLSLVAFDSARSTYDAPTIALFVAISATLTALLVNWVSDRRTRRAPAWDCGFPDPSPATQYTASSFGQPLRRVFGSVVFSARETVDMPAPGDMRAAKLTVEQTDHIWQQLYANPADAVEAISRRLNVLHFLTIRRYLVLMFSALITLLLVTAVLF
ncbi:MAG: hydrogenase 4 subunit B [Brucellaceae bacterium]|nr:hydrogenase 4 subunit B [Brucellaceae bacterium]